MISQSELKQMLHYCPETGVFTRLLRKQGAAQGSVAGCITVDGYIHIRINEKNYKAHRLAFLYMTGSWPDDQIDHINGRKDDNRFINLRSVSGSINSKNQKKPKNNSSGSVGVYWMKKTSNWMARICINNKLLFLGNFDNFFDAVCARRAAELQHNFHPNHGRKA